MNGCQYTQRARQLVRPLFPELNVSALARRMGISQSLMAQYISGKKTASKARMAMILDTIHAVGRELATV